MAYATWDDVQAIWRALTDDEAATAEALIAAAERMVAADYPDLASRVVSGALPAALVGDIVAAMVKRAMLGAERMGVESMSESVGPFSQSQKYSNPDGALYLTAAERNRLAGRAITGRSRMGWL